MKVDFTKIKDRFSKQEDVVNCPAWGGDVDLRKATAGERMDAAILIAGIDTDDDGRPLDTQAMIAVCVPIVSQSIVDAELIERYSDSISHAEIVDRLESELDPRLLLIGEQLRKSDTLFESVNAKAGALIRTITRPFDSAEGRADLLDNHPMAVVQLIPSVLKLNQLGVNADEAIDEAKKNLPTVPSGS